MSDTVRVPVVEDEALIVGFVEAALSDGGFEACSVHSGEAALSTFCDGREGCRVLLTDINLGGGNWRSRSGKSRLAFPWSTPDWNSRGVDGSVLIQKPFAPAQLAAAVSLLLDNRASPS